jgi:integrase
MSRGQGFGSVRRLPSGRWQARYLAPDGNRYTAPATYANRADARAWLALRQSEILRKAWQAPAAPTPAPVTMRDYAPAWLANRQLAATTRDHYAQVIRDHIQPRFGAMALTAITPATVRTWHASLLTDRPTARAHADGLLRTIMATAYADELIAANPCRVRGAGQAKRVKRIAPATLAELEALTAAMPEHYRLMVLLAAWCGLRFGELAELRRADLDLAAGVIHVRRGMVRTTEGRQVKGPKSDAGRRDVAIPPHLMPALTDHLHRHAQAGGQGLLFPASHGGHLVPSTLYRVFYPARASIGRPDLRFHDLRHTGAVLAAATGATLAELMARLGHSTAGAALRYQHAAADRDRVIADALSELAATATVTPIRPESGTR